MDFSEFERDWLRRHKASIPKRRRVSSVSTWFWILFWVVVATGAAIFSAAHTIPAAELTILADVPMRGDLALTAFVIVELVIFGAAAGRHEIRWLRWLLAASTLVALVGNTSSSVSAVTENGGDALNQAVGILLSIVAPMTALAAGEVLHIQLDQLSARRREADEEYNTRLQALNAKINQAYNRQERTDPPVHEISQAVHETAPSQKSRVKLHEIAREVHENGDEALSAGEMMEKYGISLGSTTKVRSIASSLNGNGHEDKGA